MRQVSSSMPTTTRNNHLRPTPLPRTVSNRPPTSSICCDDCTIITVWLKKFRSQKDLKLSQKSTDSRRRSQSYIATKASIGCSKLPTKKYSSTLGRLKISSAAQKQSLSSPHRQSTSSITTESDIGSKRKRSGKRSYVRQWKCQSRILKWCARLSRTSRTDRPLCRWTKQRLGRLPTSTNQRLQ